jgi:hypothetical protein
VKGSGNQQDYGMRVYDTRLGKFLSTDPLTKSYPDLTPYQFASNSPIQNIDLDGLETRSGNGAPTLPQIPAAAPALVSSASQNGGTATMTAPAVGTSTLASGGGAGNLVVNANGALQNARPSLGTLPTGSGLLPAQTKRITQAEFENLIPPNCTGITIDPGGKTATIFGINGTHWTVSLEKTEKPLTYWGAAAVSLQVKSYYQSSGGNLTDDVADFKKEGTGKTEYFYRAMSTTEFKATGGLLAQKDDQARYPFITQNLGYLTNKKSLIWSKADGYKYDLIVRYTVTAGTARELFVIGEWQNGNEKQTLSRTRPVLKNESYTVFGEQG